jgi:hypothetical protein
MSAMSSHPTTLGFSTIWMRVVAEALGPDGGDARLVVDGSVESRSCKMSEPVRRYT